ncbi:beta-1,3-N-acetylglucosaminyltransferase radical fringe-like isoform X3 [Chiloscyllium plagiosum]|uniref:beta-1,3-N-acetylglucosaminyltransferase radical fringe-like isoform X3 n=1 Tax=Chiloscyllium plagiosum TaxID=36176 RepID=UPI001CB83F41|nr:beta-1,3-N-acetylglucosaminyltransferase radical fringe-like isoform X3 [Chiloscyllium plagiosum]
MRLRWSANSKLCFLLSLTLCASLLLLMGLQQWGPSDLQLSRSLQPFRQTPRTLGNGTVDRSLFKQEKRSEAASAGSSIADSSSAFKREDSRHQVAKSDKVLRTYIKAKGLQGFAKNSTVKDQRGPGPWEKAAALPWDIAPHSRHNMQLSDIFIAVKTTRKYHKARLDLLYQTWISLVKEQTFIFTDGEDKELQAKAGDRMINTNCSAAHTRQALCCKMSVEYDKFIESKKKWFCHVDDDNYVNIRSLVYLLSAYSHTQDVYIGRPSLDHPVEAAERVKSDGSTTVKFWFATGGAGFCISRGLALKMSPWASFGNFISTAEKIRLPDDCTIGYIIEGLLEVKMIHSDLFHSHLENLQQIPPTIIPRQVTLSYGSLEMKRNVLRVQGPFTLADDPSRFKSIHCLLYHDAWCPVKDSLTSTLPFNGRFQIHFPNIAIIL